MRDRLGGMPEHYRAGGRCDELLVHLQEASLGLARSSGVRRGSVSVTGATASAVASAPSKYPAHFEWSIIDPPSTR